MLRAEQLQNAALQKATLEGLFQKSKKALEADKIYMREFVDLYGEENVQKDEDRLKRIKHSFNDSDREQGVEAKKLADIFEAIISEQIELSDWLGENTSAIHTAEFDDVVNGVDVIAEFNEEGKSPDYMGLAIDVSYVRDIRYKIEKIKKDIDGKNLSQIKYFRGGSDDFRGEKSNIPKVIITANPNTILELGALWQNRKNKELAGHYVQFQILDEIIVQLEAYMKYAQKTGREKIAAIYQKTLIKIKEIYDNKKPEENDSGERDSYFKPMLEIVEKIENL
ncbi:hypothetical protein A2303_06720 [Candidatus Falkowbacteria bacterium RIFOXYB2_FULL_47_14]|uniref:Uncharacterized protein n=1 Tax=Candidatus Falkowbacteria bacterium RIFOXYA2_FULL_47_19 TaxID=1797994 RepID=A0A1F5SG18_9BACT|nr:MAG: hypothetical protein A2227_00465 [Candidatus Falkowbacteria bacterium RIFOXYA2_FULL_47_19]OGF35527.1 MAG: hypothetical protein A2468_05810 [Candidatus Falkowbacteria bacterium RIFOXYC2_FULL_46_15]OGF43564.1 MAG: hypothetical protein A2303_06720 [Candidatus Falkowbacteria bacterium RIFOXYB2_FULL_47_14]